MDERFWIEMGITALIAFGATFSGVYVAFWKERKRAAAEETEQFGQILNAVQHESANNVAMLNEMKNRVRAGTTTTHEIFTETLQVALGSTLFYRRANHSLVMAARLVRTHLGKLNNSLSLYRQAAAAGRELAAADAQGLQINADAGIEFIGLLQELTEAAMNECGVAIVADAAWPPVRDRLTGIYQKERERLEKAGLWRG